jgi:hypothetical protein
MTRRPASTRAQHHEEAHAAMARVFGVGVSVDSSLSGDGAAWTSTAPEPGAEDAERRAALGRVFGTEV